MSMAPEFLKSRLFVLLIASIVAFAFGVTATVMSQTSLPAFFPAGTPITVLSLVVFAFSFLFFGYPSPFIMFIAGMFTGNHVKAFGVDATAGILSLVCIMAAYSSIRLGDALLDDMIGKGNFKQAVRISVIMIAIFLAISLGLDLRG